MTGVQTCALPIMAFAAIDDLKARYSKGEINKSEYEQMKKDLEL